MTEGRPTYKSYLLRLRREGATDAPWRASLESITQQDQQPRHFPNLESLVAYLLAELDTKQALPASGGQAGDPSESG
jgi:hypothetical protein